jgi:hypothetical protein
MFNSNTNNNDEITDSMMIDAQKAIGTVNETLMQRPDVNEYLQRLQAAAGTMRDPRGDDKLLTD